MISPKLVEVGRHLNIELLTQTELLELQGEPGAFTAKLRKKPRYIDLSKCTSCGECAKVCPISLPDAYNRNLSTRQAAYKQYAQAIPGAYAITKRGTAPCKATCPAHVGVQGFIALITAGKYREALELFKEVHPFPGVCGRVCHHPCESACTRNAVDEPLGIMNLHRFLADVDSKSPNRYIPTIKAKKDEKVAIIGAGPAGLTAAYFLAIEGYTVTVFEKLPVLGGMLTVGIPSYRLPRDIIESEIDVIRKLGVEFRTGVEIGKDITIAQLRAQGYKAFFVAIGAHECKRLGIPGEDLKGVYPGVEFLREVNLGNRISLGDRVAVIGGGNVAMDSVRTALRTGSKNPFILYRRSMEEMPASREEIAECREEGIDILCLTHPVRIIGDDSGTVRAVECIRMELGEPDASGRRRPLPVKGSEFVIDVDAVIPAIGQESDWACLTEECSCSLTGWKTMQVDPVTLQSDDPDIFSGGDAVSGPRTVVEAIAAGREAAVSIDRFIRGVDLKEGRTKDWSAVENVPTENVPHRPRTAMPHLPVDQRLGTFNEVQLGYDETQSRSEAERCLACGVCSECYQCVKACLAGAVDHEQQVEEVELSVGSVILCPGSEAYDPTPLRQFYHYGKNPNVMTSIEFERILSASGPTMGHLVRLSDHQEPKRIAWLQCVGSRDVNRCGNGYCSSVCCMYAIKEAMIAKEHAGGDLDCVVFNMDIRSFGKDYEKYFNRAKEKAGVRFVKARIHTMEEEPGTGNLIVRYVDESGAIQEEVFDLVVLSVGLQIPQSTLDLAKRLGIEVLPSRFALTRPFEPVASSRPGVYIGGVFQGPKDIPSSVTEASAAACAAGARLAPARNTCSKTVTIPDEIPVAGEIPRIGVFVCNCGINIAGVVNVPEVQAYAATLPGVVYSGQNLFTCSQDAQDQMKEIIREKRLNRIVVASCSPKTHEPIFMDTLQACGLNKYLFEMANIRNQDSWIHSGDPEGATEKAKDLVRMAVARAASLNPLQEKCIPVNKRALVVGGGPAGMTAALGMADQGFEVVLVEKEAELGGMARRLTKTIEGEDIQGWLADLVRKTKSHPLIQVLTQSLVVGFTGFKGNFTTELLVGPGMYERKVDHGAIILATGAVEYRPKEFLYGQDPRVMTQVELAQKLETEGKADYDSVVMIQCVGSRNDENPNCSRICCQSAIKNALHIKHLHPDTAVYVLYRDIRTYGLLEEYFTEARKAGVMFFRYTPDAMPEVAAHAEGIDVTFTDPILNRRIRVTTDALVLSAGMVASDTEELSSIMKLARNAEGYYLEAHVKLRPVDMATDGIFICGTAHSPKLLSESISQAMAAASRATTFLSQDSLTLSAVTASVKQDLCASCLICVRSCPYGVPRINEEGVSEIDPALCHGCGICASECPAKAIELNWYEDEQLLTEIDALLEGVI
uniref:FAD-dependent oxidoreductase n=1 Tax=Desulfatirhabdium butyrativorans TaxID=340467 RepID=A0A7C4W1L9_9BACT